jgi:uncharacterized protein
MGVLEKIQEIEREINRTQKNKATEYHLGILKAKLARYRQELLEIKTGSSASGKGEGFDVIKSGDARVALIGFPSVGKSTLLNEITTTRSVSAAYEFTTLTCIPGNIEYEGATIQLLDLPGIIQGASQGKGRGKQVISTARTADLIILMIDATKTLFQRQLLEEELEIMGIRLNKTPPNIYVKKLERGGVSFNATVPQSTLNEQLVTHILKEYKMHNAEVIVREDVTIDQFIDVLDGSRKYIPCLYVYNKIDKVSMEEIERLIKEPQSVVLSCELGLNMDYLKKMIWHFLNMTRVYSKKPGEFPDLDIPTVLRKGATIEDFCHRLHRDLASIFKYALVWGTSVKHNPQKVGLSHVLEEGDVIQIVKKT